MIPGEFTDPLNNFQVMAEEFLKIGWIAFPWNQISQETY